MPPTSKPARSCCCRSTPTPALEHCARGLHELTGATVGVVVTDTAGRAWREGQTDIAIGAAGLRVAEDFAGRVDAYGNDLVVTAARRRRRDRRAPPTWCRASSAADPSPSSAAGPTWCSRSATTDPAPAR